MKPPGKPASSACGARTAPPGAVHLSQAHQRVLVALEAYRQLRLPGVPGPAAINRVAKVDEATPVARSKPSEHTACYRRAMQ